jgi:hypothetical protein
MQPTKPWWQSRTLIVNMVVIGLTVLLAVLGQFGIAPLPKLTPELQAWVIVIVSLINMIMRWITTQPLGKE